MTVYRQNQLAWAGIMIVELTIGLLAMYLSTWLALPFLALVLTCTYDHRATSRLYRWRSN
jgi:hypothetical protein